MDGFRFGSPTCNHISLSSSFLPFRPSLVTPSYSLPCQCLHLPPLFWKKGCKHRRGAWEEEKKAKEVFLGVGRWAQTLKFPELRALEGEQEVVTPQTTSTLKAASLCMLCKHNCRDSCFVPYRRKLSMHTLTTTTTTTKRAPRVS